MPSRSGLMNLFDVPTRSERSGLGFSVTDHAKDREVGGVVKGRSVGVE